MTVQGVNDGPVAVSNVSTVQENGEILNGTEQSVLNNDVDIEGDAIAVVGLRSGGLLSNDGLEGVVGEGLEGVYGTLTLNADGSYSYSASASAVEALAAGAVEQDIFTYQISDGDKTSSAELIISVEGLNDGPVASNNVRTIRENGEIVLDSESNVLNSALDADGDPLTITGVRSGGIAATNGVAGVLGEELVGSYGTLTLNADGSYGYSANAAAVESLTAGEIVQDTFTYTITDGNDSSSAELIFRVEGVNDGPVATSNLSNVSENGNIYLDAQQNVLNNDSDVEGDILTVTALRTGRVADTDGAEGVVGEELQGLYGTLTLGLNGDYSYSASAASVESLSNGESVQDIFTYTITDGDQTSNAELIVTVQGVNDSPVAASNIALVPASGEIVIEAAQGVLIDDTDVEGDALSVSQYRTGRLSEADANQNASGEALVGNHGTLTLNADGSYSYSATAAALDAVASGASLKDTFTYTVTDGEQTSRAELIVAIQSSGSPVATGNIDAVPENGVIQLALGRNVLLDDQDPEGDPLSIEAIRTGDVTATDGAAGTLGEGLAGTYGTLTMNADGSYSYSASASAVEALAAGSSVLDTFTYTVTDGAQTSSAELVITVEGVNDGPVAVSNTNVVLENDDVVSTTAQNVLLDDTDVDAGDTLAVSALRTGGVSDANGTSGTVGEGLLGTYGTLTLNADGSYSYAATASAVEALAAGTTAIDTFTYTITDGEQTSSAELAITVQGVNDAPVAVADADSVPENGEIEVSSALGVLADDTDIDVDDTLAVSALRTGDVTATDGAAGTLGEGLAGTYGTLTMNADGSYSYSASASAVEALAAGSSVLDTFTYTVTDGAQTSSAELVITVEGVNDGPVAVSNTNVVLENDDVVSTTAQNVLLDDTDVDAGDTLAVSALRTGGVSDANGTSGTVGEGLLGTYGTLTLNADGSYSYAATASAVEALAAGTTAIDTFTYTITDGEQTSSAELAITVQGVNDPAVLDLQASDVSVTRDAQFDATGSGQILITDPDASEAVLSSATANFGTITVDGEGTWIYTLDSAAEEIQSLALGDTRTDTITFTSTDGSVSSTSITIYTANLPATLTLSGVEGALTLTAGDLANSSISGTVTITDNEGAFLLPIVSSYGAATESEGQWTYILANSSVAVLGLDAGESATDIISFQSSDAQDINQDGSILDLDTNADGNLDVIEGRQDVSVLILGVNDAPVLTSQTIAADQNDVALQASQILFAQSDDPDNADGSVTDTLLLVGARTGGLSAADGVEGTLDSGSGDIILNGNYGTLTLGSDGSYNYVSDDSAQDLALENAGSIQDVFTFRVSDGSVVSEAELTFDIDNVAPLSVAGNIVYEVLSLTAPQLSILYTDFDALTLTQDSALVSNLPSGIAVSSTVSASGAELSLSGNPASSTISFSGDAITSVNGDYLLESTVTDGDNPNLVDRFVVALRSDPLLQADGAIFEYVPGEVDYAAVYVDPTTTGTVLLNLWEPQETGDRIAVLRDPALSNDTALTLVVYASNGAILEVQGAQAVNLQYSPGADVITLTGSISGLTFTGVGASDTLINQTLILASPGTLALSLQNEGTLQLTSSGSGTNLSFDNALDGVVGETLGSELSFGPTTQSQTGAILLTPDNDPAAPYLVLASLASEGQISVSGYSGSSISQPSLLEISSAGAPTAMSQTAGATALITSGARLTAGALNNAGVITLRYDLHDQGSDTGIASGVGAGAAGHLQVTGAYAESGLLISDARSANGSSGLLADDNEVSVGSMLLTGEIKLDANLLFSNTAQTLDWREGTVSFAPDVDLRIAGGTLTLGTNSVVTGYGRIVFGSEILPDQSAGITLAIDGPLETRQFEADFDFSGAAVSINAVNVSDVLTLSASDALQFDNETVSARLQIDGSLIVVDGAVALTGQTSVSASGDVLLEGDASLSTTVQLSATQLLTNQGQIEISITAPEQGVFSVSPTVTSAIWAGGVATMTTSGAHGLTTGDTIVVAGVSLSGYDYSGVVTVVDSTSFTYNLAVDPGGPATGGVIQTFANVLVLEGGLVNSGSFTVTQVGAGDMDASVYSHESVLIKGNLTNNTDGIFTFSDGNISVEGDISNAGIIVIDSEAYVAGSNGTGASVTLGGDLILASSSQLHLEIQDDGLFYGLGFSYAGDGIIRGADSNPADLGTLVLSFDDSSDMDTSRDSKIINLGYSDIFSAGSHFNAVSANLSAGYSVTLQSNTYGTDTSRQTVSVVVADDMDFESTKAGDLSDALNWTEVYPTSDIRDISWSDASGSGLATLVTQGAHGLTTGDEVYISGSSTGFDQLSAVVTVVNATTFTYALASNPGSYAGGGSVTDYSYSAIAVSSATYDSGTGLATVVTASPHGLQTGNNVSISGVTPFEYDYSGVVTVINATTLTYAPTSPPASDWISGGQAYAYGNPPGIDDDVRIIHDLTLAAGSSISLNSLSLEVEQVIGTSTTTTNIGTLQTLSDGASATTSTTLISLNDQSTVAKDASLLIGNLGSNDAVNLALGGTLTVNGLLDVSQNTSINRIADSTGSLVVSESGTAYVQGGVNLNVDLSVERGGTLSWSSLYNATGAIEGTGSVTNAGDLQISPFDKTLTLGVDLTNFGELDLRFGSTSTGAISLTADAAVTLVNDGQLVASSFSSAGALVLNNNTLDSRDGELLLFVDPGSSTNTYSMTLTGGASAASPGILMLEDTVFAASARTVTISAQETSTDNFTIKIRTSEALSGFTPPSSTAESASISWNSPVVNQDGSVEYEGTFERTPGTPVTVTVSDSTYGAGYYGAALNIDAAGTISTSSNATGAATLNLAGHLELRLTDDVDFEDLNGNHSLTLDGSSAGSILLSNGGTETAVWANSETVRFNNLTVDTGVILANAPIDALSPEIAVTEITGVSVITGDFYNLSNGPDSSIASRLYVQGSLTFNGNVIQEAGASIFIGSLENSASSVATSLAFANDFSNAGNVTVGFAGGSEAHTIVVGSSATAGTFHNSGGFAASSFSGTTTLDALLNNTGDLLIQSQFVLDATAGGNHVSSGVVSLEGVNAGLTLGGTGGADVFTVLSTGYLVTSNSGLGIEVMVSPGSSLEIDGHLGIGDTVLSSEPGNVSLATGIDDLTITTENEVTIGGSAVVAMDVTFGASNLNDALTVTTATTGGVLRLSGGRLALSSVYSSAGGVVTMIAASSILGSFDTVDGLILDDGASRTVADIDQLASTITLTPLSDSTVLQEGSASGDAFDFSVSSTMSHYLGAGGDDLITGMGFGDTAYGEAGNDTFVLDASSVRRVDGGAGLDRIVLPGNETTFDFTAGWLGHTFERIELLSMDDALSQTLVIDAKGIKSIVDGQSDLLDGDVGLTIDGNAGDVINLNGDFEFVEDRYLLTHNASVSGSTTTLDYQPELYTGVSDGSVSLFFDQAVTVNVSHSSGGVSRYGDETSNTLTGTNIAGESLVGRAGDDVLDGKSGADRQLGGDGNDTMVFDSADTQTDGGNGVDTLLISGNIDFSQLTNATTNIEQLDSAGNGTADIMTLSFSDVFDLVGDNSLAAFVTDHAGHSEHKVLVVNGDNEDTLIIEGVDVRDTTPVSSGIDLFGDGKLYALFQDTTLGVDIYVLSSLLEDSEASGADSNSPVMGSASVAADLYEIPQDNFGGL
ncbi:MAG: VCBS domain-containing protein [Pseudomonadales bacterium]